jgi:2-polyprenyl-3-methyl-5-hydroxy-6-metoxy-1,4-benzoquinol methylase
MAVGPQMSSFEPIDFYNDAKTGRTRGERGLESRERIAIRAIQNLKGGSVLDIGCGNGFFLRNLEQNLLHSAFELQGVDFSNFEIERAQKDPRHSKITFTQANAEKGLDFPENHFDVVFSGEVIEHLYDPDTFLDQIFRILKPGGMVVLTTPNLLSWFNRILALIGIQPVTYEASVRDSKIGFGFLKSLKKDSLPVGHIRLMSYLAVRDIVKQAGFKELKFHGSLFEQAPGVFLWIDQLFRGFPSLASGLVVIAKKPL